MNTKFSDQLNETINHRLATNIAHANFNQKTNWKATKHQPSLRRARQGTLGTLACSAKTAKSTRIRGQILLVLAFEFSNEVIDHSVVKVLTCNETTIYIKRKQITNSNSLYRDIKKTLKTKAKPTKHLTKKHH